MNQEQGTKKIQDDFIKRMQKLNDDYLMLIESITDLREKMYTLCDTITMQHIRTNPHIQIDKAPRGQSKFSSSSSFHIDYQYIQSYFELATEKLDQQFIKDINKDFWKLYLKSSLLDGNKANYLLMQAKALNYPKLDEVIKNKEILKRYFSEQQKLDDSQRSPGLTSAFIQNQNSSLNINSPNAYDQSVTSIQQIN